MVGAIAPRSGRLESERLDCRTEADDGDVVTTALSTALSLNMRVNNAITA
jgi:hypothetical protein